MRQLKSFSKGKITQEKEELQINLKLVLKILIPTVSFPAYEFQFNLVVNPLPATARKTVSIRLKRKDNLSLHIHPGP